MTVVPSLLGMILGAALASQAQPFPNAATTILSIAVVGWLLSLGIDSKPAADATRSAPLNPFAETTKSLRVLKADPQLLHAALGIAFFWTLSSLALTNMDQLGEADLQLTQQTIGWLGMSLVLGVGVGSMLASVLAMRRVLLRDVLSRDEQHVGILLPPTAGDAIANLAVTLSGRVAVNLNYTMSEKDINYFVKDAGLKHVLTSKKLIEKKPLQLDVPFVFLEDLKEQVRSLDRLLAGIGTYVLPASILERLLGLTRTRMDDPITIIYTSGSTEPRRRNCPNNNHRAPMPPMRPRTSECLGSMYQIHG